MDSIDPADEFRQEADDLLIQLEDILLNLAQYPDDGDLVDSAFRILHSIKGAGMTFGWGTLAAFIHQVETPLVQVRNGFLPVTPDLIAINLRITDHIRELLEQPENVDPARSANLLSAIADITNGRPPSEAAMTLSPIGTRTVRIGHPTLRVSLAQLDHLMDQVAELSLVQERLSQVIAENPTQLTLQSIGKDIGRLTTGLRDTTMTLRMLPIGVLFRQFRRVVYDLSLELGKTIELVLSGEETTLDKFLIQELYAPLVHLIRNAIDHGIELPDERIAAGKPAMGQLRLGALHADDEVIITMEDDGRGLDVHAIRAKAEACGLLHPNQAVSTSELFSYIFQAGFSTVTEVTNISGRGVGMDVVKRAIENLHGTIALKSELGQGTAVILRLPISLAIIDTLLVRTATPT